MIRFVLGLSLCLFGLGGVGMFLANRKVDPETRRRRWIKYLVYVLIVYTVIGSALAGPFYFSMLMLLIVIRGAYELFAVLGQKGFTGSRIPIILLASLLYLFLALGMLSFASDNDSEAQVFVYLTIAVFDGFSQITGQMCGKHHFAPKLSPNKTLEGTLGGLVAAILTAIALRSLTQYSWSLAVLLGITVSLAALVGDLLASWCKRVHGVKDFRAILPEHGGVLDRFDSLFMASTAFWLSSLFLF